MKRLLFLTILVAAASCADEVRLNSICKNDVFDFEGREVNSYFAIQLNFTLPQRKSLQLDDRLDDEFKRWTSNSSELQQLIAKKDEFNRIVQDFYRQDKINEMLNVTEILRTRKAILNIRAYFQSWYGRLGFGEKIVWHTVMNANARTNEFLQNLVVVKMNKLNEKIVPVDFMAYLQIYLGENLKPGQQVVFLNHFEYYLYIERILRFDNVTVGENDTQLFATVVVPIADHYKPEGACTPASELPSFFSEYLVL